jgi:hypothetical protein
MADMTTLDGFLVAAARTPFAWGTHDCCLWLADWLVALGRPDPAAHLRDRYRTELGCARVLTREGGVLGVVAACAVNAGLARTACAVAGDVGVVQVETARGLRPAGGIFLGRRWASLGEAGLVVAERVPLAAWRV